MIRYYLLFYVTGIMLAGCGTCDPVTLPVTDTSSPTFTLRLWGPGLDTTFNDRTFEGNHIFLLKGAQYRILLVAKDPGGISNLQVQIPSNDVFRIIQTSPDDLTIRDIGPGLTRMAQVLIEERNARECSAISFHFNPLEEINWGLGVGAFDFGGGGGAPNHSTTARSDFQNVDEVEDVRVTRF